jgi:hypothetical protein
MKLMLSVNATNSLSVRDFVIHFCLCKAPKTNALQ